jgi:hypothetical protein
LEPEDVPFRDRAGFSLRFGIIAKYTAIDKTTRMKKIWVFYLCLLLPIIGPMIVVFNRDVREHLPAYSTIWFLVVYIFVYRQVLCGIRLIQGHKIPASQFFYNFIPGWNSKFSGFLFFNKID